MRQFFTFMLSGMVFFLAACGQGEKQGENQPELTSEMESDTMKVTLKQVWATDTTQLFTPEAATYHPEKNVFYISNLNRDNEAENDGYISIVNADGSIKNAKWVEGLGSPLGSDFYNGHLYVNDDGNIVKIDIESGKIIERIRVDGASDLNGMDIDENGNIYAADSDGNKVFKVSQNGEITVVFEGEELNTPNGVFIKDNELIVASSGGNSLKSINLENKEIRTLVEGIGTADGIIQLDGGHYLTSNWTGEVYFISNDMKKQKILDTKAQEINAADIGYIPQENLLVVPTFYDNRLVAYKVNIN